MSMQVMESTDSIRDQVSAEEWQARIEPIKIDPL